MGFPPTLLWVSGIVLPVVRELLWGSLALPAEIFPFSQGSPEHGPSPERHLVASRGLAME